MQGIKLRGKGLYGTDQAYLRYLHNANDKSDVVILSFTTENIIRNVNRLRDLISDAQFLRLKPRFIFTNKEKIIILPIESFDYDTYVSAIINPDKHFKNEYFIPGMQSGIQRFSFPYTAGVIGILGNFRFRAKLDSRPHYAEFYDIEHPSGALKITAAILNLFTLGNQKSGGVPIIVILPTCRDLEYFLKHDKLVYQPLLDQMKETDAQLIDLGQIMIEHLGDRDPEELFVDCSGHFNEEGERTVANLIYRQLKDKRLLDQTSVHD